MKRFSVLLYGVVVYSIFFLTFLYLIGFIGNIIVPITLDGELTVPLWQALLTNTALCALFGLQHSIMARQKFKKWLTQYIPEAMERSTFCLFTSLVLISIFTFWQPMGGVLWSVEAGLLKGVLLAIFALGWALVLASTFAINHFDLFGLRQVWLYFRKKEYTHLKFQVNSFYKVIRHPIYLGMVLALWAAPVMSISRLVFAILLTSYIFVGIYFEEKDLIKVFGTKYTDYKSRVPKIFPRILSGRSKRPVYETIIKNPANH